MFIVMCKVCRNLLNYARLGEPYTLLPLTWIPGSSHGYFEVSQFINLTRHNYNNKYFVERSFLRPIRIKIYNDTMRKCVGMGATPIFFATTVFH